MRPAVRGARDLLVVLHRWMGLATAGFLVIVGLTGALLPWEHPLDAWLNADLMETPGRGPLRDPLELAALAERSDARVRASYVPLGLVEGQAAGILVAPRTDPATGKPYALDYNYVFIDPVTGAITGRRDSRSVALSRRNLMPWLHHLHTNLLVPPFAGSDRWGYRFMGTVALVWLLDSLVAMVLTWPRRAPRTRAAPGSWWQRWAPSWRLRWAAGGYRRVFDLHRAGGLWVWGVILVLAFTSFSLNLYREVFYPVLSLVSQTTPTPYETRTPAPFGTTIAPRLGFAQALAIGRAEAQRRGFVQPPGGIYYADAYGFYNVSFFPAGDADVDAEMVLHNLYIDANDGRVLGETVPWKGTASDVFAQLQLPLHSGRILGLPGSILMSGMGVMVAMLSVTGVLIWWRKRQGRLQGHANARASRVRPDRVAPR